MRSRLRNYRATWNGGIQKSDEVRLDGKRRRKIASETPAENTRKCKRGKTQVRIPDLGLFAWIEPRADCGGQKIRGRFAPFNAPDKASLAYLSSSQLLAKARVVTTARGNLIRWNGGGGGRWGLFIEMDGGDSPEERRENARPPAPATGRRVQVE